jgi:hypothetical protein
MAPMRYVITRIINPATSSSWHIRLLLGIYKPNIATRKIKIK